MAAPAWNIKTRNDLIVTLFALIESKTWTITSLSDWCDSVIASVDVPQYWLIELSLNATGTNELNAAFRSVMHDNDVRLPENFYEACGGLVLLKYKAGLIREEDVRGMLADLADPGGINGIQIEAIWDIDLQDPRLTALRESARFIAEFAGSGHETRLVQKYCEAS